MIYRVLLAISLLVLLIFIASRSIDLTSIPSLLWEFPHIVLGELIFISVLISLLKAWRFLILLRNTNFTISFWTTIKTFVAGQAITPLPGGEAIRGLLIRYETGQNILKTTGPIVTQAYLELTSAAIMAMFGALVFKTFRIPILIVLIVMILIALIITNGKIMKYLSHKFSKVKFVNSFLSKMQFAQIDIKANFYDHKSGLPDKVLVRTLGLSLFSQMLSGLLIYIIAHAYKVDLDILQSIFISSIGMVIQGIGSVVPGGLGITEGGMTGVLVLSDVGFSKALAIVLIFRVMTLLLNIILGLVFLVRYYARTLILSQKAIAK